MRSCWYHFAWQCKRRHNLSLPAHSKLFHRQLHCLYETAIILSYGIQQLVLHFTCLNISLIQKRQNCINFEEGGIPQGLKCLLLKSFIICSWSFFWHYHLKDPFCSFSSNYLINYLIIYVLYVWLCNNNSCYKKVIQYFKIKGLSSSKS